MPVEQWLKNLIVNSVAQSETLGMGTFKKLVFIFGLILSWKQYEIAANIKRGVCKSKVRTCPKGINPK